MTYCHIIGKKQMNTMYNFDNSCMKTIILYRNLPTVNPDELRVSGIIGRRNRRNNK